MSKIKIFVVIFMAMFLMLPAGMFAQEIGTATVIATTESGEPVHIQVEPVDNSDVDPLVIAPNPVGTIGLDVQEIVDDGVVSYEDLGVEKPTRVPSRFGFWWQGVKQKFDLAFTFNKIKKAKKQLHYINQGMVHAKNILENSDDERLKNAATKRIEFATKLSGNWKDRMNNWKVEEGESATKIEHLKEIYLDKELKHQQLLQHLETKAPEHAFEKVKVAREKRLQHLKEVFEKAKPKISAKFKKQVQKLTP